MTRTSRYRLYNAADTLPSYPPPSVSSEDVPQAQSPPAPSSADDAVAAADSDPDQSAGLRSGDGLR